ncbi:MAG: hypothetical protein H8D24_07185 [Gammaproteobacteria bacterium]|uniref:Uncharacterized protein n=1 Tax=Candidatus Thiopontia autotrophica TaxID=2841688 RepID=A0A8J6TT03_9GAMM|nr:hypothetical protein [Candidatus Thiopontia autotrophica]MBL6968605.1 hypothetical protein [Gammaproteobacteria bacterium]
MHDKIIQLMDKVVDLEQELERDLEEKQTEFRYRLEEKRIHFEREMTESQRQLKVGLFQFIRRAKLRTLLSVPVIYGLALPLLIVDISVTIYQWICFTLWGMGRVRRRDYWLMDRGHLAYLNAIEKINCYYCSYANGLASYISEVASRTEQYWCPIKHARRVQHPHPRYWRYSDFGDAEAYRSTLDRFRKELG